MGIRLELVLSPAERRILGSLARLAAVLLLLIPAVAAVIVCAAGGIEYNSVATWVSSQFFGQLAIYGAPLNVSDPNLLSYLNTYVVDQQGQPYYSYLFSSYPPFVLWVEGAAGQKIYNVFYGGTNPYPEYVATPSTSPLFAAYDDFDYETGYWTIYGRYTVAQSQLQLDAGSLAIFNTSYEPRVVAIWLLRGARTGLAITLYSPVDYTGWVHIHLDNTNFADWSSIKDGTDIYFLDAATLQPLNYSVLYLSKTERVLDAAVYISIGAGQTKTIYMLYGQDNPYTSYRVEPTAVEKTASFESPTSIEVYRIQPDTSWKPTTQWVTITQNATLKPGTTIVPHIYKLYVPPYAHTPHIDANRVEFTPAVYAKSFTMIVSVYPMSSDSRCVFLMRTAARYGYFVIDVYPYGYRSAAGRDPYTDKIYAFPWASTPANEFALAYDYDNAITYYIDNNEIDNVSLLDAGYTRFVFFYYIEIGFDVDWDNAWIPTRYQDPSIWRYLLFVNNTVLDANTVREIIESHTIPDAVSRSVILFFDPTFYNGTHYLDLTRHFVGNIRGTVVRVLDEDRWLWTIYGLYSDSYLHLRFFPYGSVVKIYNASSGTLVAWIRVVGFTNPAGLVEELDVPIQLPEDVYTVVVEAPVTSVGSNVNGPPFGQYPSMPQIIVYSGQLGEKDTTWRTSSGGIVWWEYVSADLSIGWYVPGRYTAAVPYDLATAVDIGNIQPFLKLVERTTPYYTVMPLPTNITIETTAAIEPNTTIAPHLYDWYFDGVNSRVSVPSFSTITTLPFAVEVLVKYDTFQQPWCGIVSWDRDANKGFWLLTHAYVNAIVIGTGNGDTYGEMSVSMNEHSGRWTYIAVNYFVDRFDVYVDSTYVGTRTLDIETKLPVGNPLFIGSRRSGWYSHGFIAFVRIFNRALTETEINSVYTANASDLALFLDPTFFNGTHYIDLSQHHNDGVPYGNVKRIPAEERWLWIIYNASSDNLVHLRFFPLGTVVRFYDASSGELVKEAVVANATNAAGLVEDYTVKLPAGTYRIVAIIAPHSYQIIRARSVYLANNYAIAPHLYDWYFDGEDDYIDVGAFNSVDPSSDFAIALMFSPVETPIASVIMGQFGGDPLWVRVNYKGKLAAIYLGGAENPGYHPTQTTYQDLTWRFVAFTVSGTTLNIYVDTSLETTVDIGTGRRFSNGNPLWIGWTPYRTPHPPYRGYIAYTIIYARALDPTSIADLYNNHKLDPTSLVLFLDPTFFNGTHYIDLSPSRYAAIPRGDVKRVPAEERWLWVVPNLYNDGYLHLRFFPYGSIVRLYRHGRVVTSFFVTCTPNAAGLCEDYKVWIPPGTYDIEVLVPYPPIDTVEASVGDIGDLEARDSYDLQTNLTAATSMPMTLLLDMPAVFGLIKNPHVPNLFWGSYFGYSNANATYESPSNDTAVQVRFRYEPGERLAVAILNISLSYGEGIANITAVVYNNGSWLWLCYLPDSRCVNTSIALDSAGWYLLTVVFEKPNRIRILLGNGSYVPGGIYQDTPREFVYSATVYGPFAGTYALGVYVTPSDMYGLHESVLYDWARIVQYPIGRAKIVGTAAVERIYRVSYLLSGNATSLGIYLSGVERLRIIVPRVGDEPIEVWFGNFTPVAVQSSGGVVLGSYTVSTDSVVAVVGNTTAAVRTYTEPGLYVVMSILPNGTAVLYADGEPLMSFSAGSTSFMQVMVEIAGGGTVTGGFFTPLYLDRLKTVSTAPSIVPVSSIAGARGVVVGWIHSEAAGYMVCGINVSTSAELFLDINGTVKSVPIAPAALPAVVVIGYDYNNATGSVSCFAMYVWSEGRYTRYRTAIVEASSPIEVGYAYPFINASTSVAVERFGVTLGWAFEALAKGALSLSILGPVPVGGLVKYVALSRPVIIDISSGELRIYPGGAKGITLRGFRGWTLNFAIAGTSVSGVVVSSDEYVLDVPLGFTAMVVVNPSSRQISIVAAAPSPPVLRATVGRGENITLPSTSIAPPPTPITQLSIDMIVLGGAMIALAIAAARLSGDIGLGIALAGFVATILCAVMGNTYGLALSVLAIVVGIGIRIANR